MILAATLPARFKTVIRRPLHYLCKESSTSLGLAGIQNFDRRWIKWVQYGPLACRARDRGRLEERRGRNMATGRGAGGGGDEAQ